LNSEKSVTTIRPFAASDWRFVWPLLHDTLAAGDTCAFSPNGTESEIHAALRTVQLAMPLGPNQR
jgi:hypothetical protein